MRRFFLKLFRRSRLQSDVEAELSFHRAMAQEQQNPIPLGNPMLIKEQAFDLWQFGGIETIWRDIGFAARTLRKSPGFVAVVVFSLALGIAANSTMFSVVNAERYRSLPYEDADRLMVIWEFQNGEPEQEMGPPIAELVDWKKQNHVFEDIALTSSSEAEPMAHAGHAELIHQQWVTPNFFSVLRVKPEIGRVFASDEIHDTSQAVLVSDAFWKRRFGGNPGVIGTAVTLSGVESTVVGIMPPHFAPFQGGAIDFWVPIDPSSVRYSERQDRGWLMPVGRLKPGATRTQAAAEMNVIAERLERAYPKSNRGIRAKVIPLREVVSDWTHSLYPLFGAVAFVLLIACLNVANLQQARTQKRRAEQALRASLGASRRRLIQQVLTESGVLACAGGVAGLGLTLLGIVVFRKLVPDFPNAENIVIDARVLLFTIAISCLTAILFGVVPAFSAAGSDVNAILRQGESARVAGSRGWTRQVLAILEVALAMVLLTGAGLMINSVLQLKRVSPGFDSANLMLGNIALPEGGKYVQRVPGGDMELTTPYVSSFFRRVRDAMAATPGVVGAAFKSQQLRGITFSVVGRAPVRQEQRPQAAYGEISPTYFQTLRIPLKRGRYLRDGDVQNAPWVVVVNEALARQQFPNEDPIGKQVLLRFENYHIDEDRPREIVGVVGDIKHFGLKNSAPPAIYASYLQQPASFPGGCTLSHIAQTILVRVRADSNTARNFAPVLQKVVAGIDPDQPVTGIMSMNEHLDGSIDDSRFVMRLLEIFAGIALLLAVIGIYGVMSYFVTERTREMGIRMALGADRARLLQLVIGVGLRLTLGGVCIGCALAFALTRVIQEFLFGVKPADPVTFAAVAALLGSIAILACFVPALRATMVDPMIALRHD